MSETLHYEPHSKNAGRELRQQGDPEQVRVHDFKLPELGKGAPYLDFPQFRGVVETRVSTAFAPPQFSKILSTEATRRARCSRRQRTCGVSSTGRHVASVNTVLSALPPC